ncbi:MAG: 4-hydroxy-tetrahydrodipicolinate reductase [Gammaproteobacteria bacterium]|nr:4-hydroxy-tetrahydrodipicolinate reductase [Gammaproteobacteria bacterium]
MIRIAIAGAAGRMGRSLIEACDATPGVTVGAAVERADSPFIGRDLCALAGGNERSVPFLANLAAATGQFDVLVDFTNPSATIANLEVCRAAGKRMVIGTTGLDGAQRAIVDAGSRDIAIVVAPNMSIGVNLCFKLAELAARVVGDDTDIEIVEAHHSQKKDAPSGTALRFGEIIAGALGRDLRACAVYKREGETGPRRPGTIGFESIRAGDIVGDHTVLFASAGERIEITHRASTRATFAAGALRAAQWIMGRERGLFDMQDVLGLR